MSCEDPLAQAARYVIGWELAFAVGGELGDDGERNFATVTEGRVSLASVVRHPEGGRALWCVLAPEADGRRHHVDIRDWAATIISDPELGPTPLKMGGGGRSGRWELSLKPPAPGDRRTM